MFPLINRKLRRTLGIGDLINSEQKVYNKKNKWNNKIAYTKIKDTNKIEVKYNLVNFLSLFFLAVIIYFANL